MIVKQIFAQLAEAVKYTDCIIAEGVRPPPVSVLDMTLNSHLFTHR